MEEPKYLDFELRIEKKGQRYEAAVLHSPCGEASYTFRRPFSDLEVENFVLRMGGARRVARRISSPEMQTARQFGSKLFEAVFCEDIRTCFISSQNEAKHHNLGLRLKLRVEAPELINIPWEYLYDASLGRFLSLFENSPIVRYIDVRERISPLAVKPPLSVLVMVSSPTDYPTLDVARERANLQQALGVLADEGMLTLEWVEKANLPTLADCLLRGRYHIFHYIGHGGFDERSQDGVLVLEDEQCLGQWASGERLAVLLGNQPTLRLVILNACEGARTSCDDPFAGAATTLVRTGNVPAVVAMQFAITDEAAITFARGFYSALAVGRPVDAAVTQARLAIFAAGNDVEWGTPVLYMRSPDGRIFDVEALSPEERAARRHAAGEARVEAEARATREAEEAERRVLEQRQTRLATLYEQATTRLANQDWAEACDLLAQIQAMAPGYRQVGALLSQAHAGRARAQQVAAMLAQGSEHLGRREWSQATAAYQQVLSLAPGHPEALAGLAEAQRQEKVATLYAEAQGHLQAGRWSEAITAFQAVLELVPTHAGAAQQLAGAQAQWEHQQAEERKRRKEEARQAELARLYAMADEAAQSKNWSKAIESFEGVLRSDPGYRDAAARLAQARDALAAEQAARERESQLAKLYGEALAHLQAQRWTEAIAGFRAVLAIDPHYGDPTHGSAALLLARAQQQSELAKSPPPPAGRPPRPTTLPEDIKPSGKPRKLPK
jgi:outer membrane protein assembly factor BamD (BamD/ComL family)